MSSPELQIQKLIKAFPCLRGASGTSPFDAKLLDHWAATGASTGERLTTQFILGVWNRHEEWQCGAFNVFHAVNAWDEGELEAFAAWAKHPFTL